MSYEPVLPYACRTYPSLIKALASVMEDDAYLSMNRNQFIGAIMQKTGGSANLQSFSQWYDRLMTDAFGENFETKLMPRSS